MLRRALLLPIILLGACRGGGDAAIPQWTLVEDLRIGGAESGPASLTAVLALSFDQGGRIWLVDRDRPEIRVFDPKGTFVRTIGGPGEGPGEMAVTNGFAIAPNGLIWVPDHRLRRYNSFDTAGRFVASHPDLITSSSYMWDGGVDSQGRLYDRILIRRDTSYIPKFRRFRDSSLTTADTLPFPTCRSGRSQSFRLDAKNGYTIMSVPYAPLQVVAISPEGILWCASGEQSAAVAVRIEDGDTVAQIAYDRPRLPVPVSARDSAIAAITKQAQEMGADLPDFGLIPSVQPAVIGLKVDDVGRVWLRVPDPAVTRFDLFDRTGARLAEVTFPRMILRWGPIAFRGDTLLAVVQDVDDVPSVVRLHLVRGTAP
ncbi:MAG TPA: 6-bladed beta-propeller [Gemmatimonadales bacterium]|nr:6-bladed beta-propeller [Gemmatimonadales bacterium]